MIGYNAILVYDKNKEKLLFCKRRKDPYEGKLNFVGGKIEEHEDGFSAAYRELYEETGISRDDIELYHLMDFTYHKQGFYMEIYAGQLNKELELVAEKNPLVWVDASRDFFDVTQYAGDGNIGHIVRIANGYGFGVRENENEA